VSPCHACVACEGIRGSHGALWNAGSVHLAPAVRRSPGAVGVTAHVASHALRRVTSKRAVVAHHVAAVVVPPIPSNAARHPGSAIVAPTAAAERTEHGPGSHFVGAIWHVFAVHNMFACVAQPLVAARPGVRTLAAQIAKPQGLTLVHFAAQLKRFCMG